MIKNKCLNSNPIAVCDAFGVPNSIFSITTMGGHTPPKASVSCAEEMEDWLYNHSPNVIRDINLGLHPSECLIRITECFVLEQQHEISQISREEAEKLSELWQLFISSIEQKLNRRSYGQAISTIPQIKDLLNRLNFLKQ